MTHEQRTQVINDLHKHHPGTRLQLSYHGADHYSVQFFDRKTGKIVAEYDISQYPYRLPLYGLDE